MASVELYESRTYSLAGAIVRGQRAYLVETTSPQLALLDPIIPAYGSGFEFTPGKKGFLRTYNVDRYGPSSFKVVCEYDNDGSSRGPQLPDDQDPIYKDINVTYTRDTEKIPAFLLFFDRVEPLDGIGPPSLRERWEPYDFTVDAYYATAEVTINLPTMNAGVQRDIAKQVNVIHQFPDGLYWQFIGATTTRQAESQWQITYRWIHDPGQPSGFAAPILTPDNEYRFIDSPPGTVPEGSLIVPELPRGAFEKWRVLPSSAPGTRPQIGVLPFDVFRSFQPDGYETLPGNPI